MLKFRFDRRITYNCVKQAAELFGCVDELTLRLANSIDVRKGSQLEANSYASSHGSIKPQNGANKSKNLISVHHLISEHTGSIGELSEINVARVLCLIITSVSTPDLTGDSKLDWSQ